MAPGLAPVQSVAGRAGTVALGVADVAGAAPLAGAGLTGATTISTRSGGKFTVVGTQPGAGGFAKCTYMLVAKTSSTTAARLTTDGNAPGSLNCINPAANSADDLFVEVIGIDATSAGNVARYRALDVLLDRGATAAEYVGGQRRDRGGPERHRRRRHGGLHRRCRYHERLSRALGRAAQRRYMALGRARALDGGAMSMVDDIAPLSFVERIARLEERMAVLHALLTEIRADQKEMAE